MDRRNVSSGQPTAAVLMKKILSATIFVNHESHLVSELILAWIKQLEHADAARMALQWNGIKFHRFYMNAIRHFDGKECVAFIPAILCHSPILRGVVGPRTASAELLKIPNSVFATIQLAHIGNIRSLRAVAISEDDLIRDYLA